MVPPGPVFNAMPPYSPSPVKACGFAVSDLPEVYLLNADPAVQTEVSPIVVTPDACCTQPVVLTVVPSDDAPPPGDWRFTLSEPTPNNWSFLLDTPSNPPLGTYKYVFTFAGCTPSTPPVVRELTVFVV